MDTATHAPPTSRATTHLRAPVFTPLIPQDGVAVLDETNFDSVVGQGAGAFVEFYAPVSVHAASVARRPPAQGRSAPPSAPVRARCGSY